MQKQMTRLVVFTVANDVIETEFEDIEMARETGQSWLIKGWAKAFCIEKC